MVQRRFFLQLLWGALSIGSGYGFLLAMDSVAWLVAWLSATVPLFASLVLTSIRWDRNFLSIVVWSLGGVAFAVIGAQWFMFKSGAPYLVMVPTVSVISWMIHERVR